MITYFETTYQNSFSLEVGGGVAGEMLILLYCKGQKWKASLSVFYLWCSLNVWEEWLLNYFSFSWNVYCQVCKTSSFWVMYKEWSSLSLANRKTTFETCLLGVDLSLTLSKLYTLIWDAEYNLNLPVMHVVTSLLMKVLGWGL